MQNQRTIQFNFQSGIAEQPWSFVDLALKASPSKFFSLAEGYKIFSQS